MPSRPGSTAKTPPETPALGGQPHRHEPLAGEVVHAARGHHAQHVAHDALADGALTRQRVDAAVREGRGHHGHVAALDRDGALAEVEVERGVGIVEHAAPAQDVRHAPVAVPGLGLGAVDRVIELESATRVARVRVEQDAVGIVGVRRDEPRARDRTGIDQGVLRAAGAGGDAELVERVAARLDAHPGVHDLPAQALEREAVGQRLRHRLDREQHARVAGLVDRAVDRGDADAEQQGVRVRELGDVRRDLARHVGAVATVEPLEVGDHGRGRVGVERHLV
jgi:hypothetical protein